MPDNHMIFSVDEAEQLTLIPKKTTVIVASCQCEMRTFMLSFLALVLRSKPENVEHFMVALNGGDDRYNNAALQDKKQLFLEEVRRLKWNNKDMPLTISRTWSRVGHTQALESCIPWVHTEYYTISHDDVLVQKGWDDEFMNKMEDKQTILAFHPPLLMEGLSKNYHEDGWKVSLPHMNSALITCKKALMTKLGVRWYGYHIKNEFKLYEKVEAKEFLKYHNENGHIESFPFIEGTYKYANMDVGSWVYDAIKKSSYKMSRVNTKVALHLGGMSWEEKKYDRKKRGEYQYNLSEMELDKYPEFKEVYEKNL
jgi:hypothetical protein